MAATSTAATGGMVNMTKEDALPILALIQVGQELSNVMHNYMQSDKVPEDFRNKMRQMVNKWDATEKAARHPMYVMRQLRPAFDPIELGA